ncbi:hypothetical protein EV368DRAFT_87923 [Lentinula lateritia]|nr:hypothetical protein EV368DRAFT_87923 [Lentinula lateritia]
MAFKLMARLARLTFRFIYGTATRLASFSWKGLYLLTFVWLTTLPFLNTISTVIGPLCVVPGISSTSLCSHFISHQNYTIHPLWADFPRLMNAQSLTFEQLLDSSVGGSGLSLDLKKAEMAISDLVVLVKFSELTSKDVLGDALSTFAHDARRTGRGLQTLGSKVGGAVDMILAVNEYAMAKLSSIPPPSSFISHSLVPFNSISSLEKIFLASFVESMSTLSTIIQCLILLAEVELSNLEKLEDHLSIIYEIVCREDSSISSAKAELLGEIWTWLGGNRRELKASALQILRALSDDMEDMRERMIMPDLVGSQIPLEVQISSIQHGLQRLRDSKVLAKDKEEGAMRRVAIVEE